MKGHQGTIEQHTEHLMPISKRMYLRTSSQSTPYGHTMREPQRQWIMVSRGWWRMLSNNCLITGGLERSIRYSMQQTEARAWWMKKFKIHQYQEDDISWGVYEEYRSAEHPSWLNIWSVKFGAGILPTMTNVSRRGHSEIPICPRCEERKERQHFLCCPHADVQVEYEKGLSEIARYLERTRTSSTSMQRQVLHLLHYCRHNTATPENL